MVATIRALVEELSDSDRPASQPQGRRRDWAPNEDDHHEELAQAEAAAAWERYKAQLAGSDDPEAQRILEKINEEEAASRLEAEADAGPRLSVLASEEPEGPILAAPDRGGFYADVNNLHSGAAEDFAATGEAAAICAAGISPAKNGEHSCIAVRAGSAGRGRESLAEQDLPDGRSSPAKDYRPREVAAAQAF